MKKIAITEAHRIANLAGADTVVVFAFTAEQFSAVSYGTTKGKCVAAAKWMDRLADELKSGTRLAPDQIEVTARSGR